MGEWLKLFGSPTNKQIQSDIDFEKSRLEYYIQSGVNQKLLKKQKREVSRLEKWLESRLKVEVEKEQVITPVVQNESIFSEVISQGTRFDILKRDGYKCQICGRNPQEDNIKLEIDHKIPRSKGGKDTLANLWTLCYDCNRGKRAKDL